MVRNTGTISDILQTPQFLFWTVFTIYLICYFGEIFFGCQRDIGHETYQSSWYLLPNEQQKMMILVISIAQNPVFLNAFGTICCTIDTFQRVDQIVFVMEILLNL